MRDPAGLSILAVSPVAEAGGAETFLLDVLSGLQGAGVAVALLALGKGPLAGLAESRGVSVFTGPALSFRSPRSVMGGVAAVRRARSSVRPNVVLASHPKGQVISRLATVGDRSLAHVTQLYDPPSRDSVSTRVAARVPGLRLSITDETAEAYRALNRGLDPIVIPPGTDGDRLRRDARCGDADRAWVQAGLHGSGPRVVMTGRLQRFKGPFDFVALAAHVSRSRPDVRFLLIGPDSPIEPGLRQELQSTIEAKGLSATIALAGRLSADDLAATVADATVLVHPAHREPFGLAVVEALTLGTPVVAYATTGPAVILQTGGGAIVPVGDVEALGQALLGALDDPNTLARWAAEAGATAGRFDLETTVARYLAVLEQAAPSRARSAVRAVTTIGVSPAEASGVRDYGHLLEEELERRGVAVQPHWLENAGDRLVPALRISVQLLALGLTLPRKGAVIWHYSPVPYGFRGLPAFGVLVGVALRARGCRVVSVLHELAYSYRPRLDPPQAWVKASVQQLALRAVLAGSTDVVVTTERRRATLETDGGVRGPRISVIPVFPTIPRDGRAPATPAEGPFVLGVLGYAGDGVRPDLLFGAVLGRADDIRIVLLGAPGPDSEDGRRWLRLAAEHGVGRSLEFTGVVEATELSRRLADSTIVVLVNEEGPSSRKTTLAAALSHGLPVVSLDGYNRWDELIEAGAVRVVPNDAVALGSVLAYLRDSPSERTALGAAAASFADAHMTLSGAADVFVELLAHSAPQATGEGGSPTHADASADSYGAATAGLSSQPSRSQGSGATA